jgi:hypothetical protein
MGHTRRSKSAGLDVIEFFVLLPLQAQGGTVVGRLLKNIKRSDPFKLVG